MSRAILDQRGNVLKTLHVHDDRRIEVTEENIDGILALAERQRQIRGETMAGHHDGMVLAGYIPEAVWERMCRDGSVTDEAALKRWMNDPQNSCFRVWKGTV
jgi:hypothetical protein